MFNSKKIESLDASRAQIVAQMGLLRDRRQEEKSNGMTNHMDSIRFSPEQYARFAELWPQYTSEDRHRLLAPPNGIPPAMESLLSNVVANAALPDVKHPDWLSYMVDLRDDFAGTAFFADSKHPTGDVIYKLLLSIAQPRRVVFLECHRAKGGLSGLSAHGRYVYEAFRFVPPALVPWNDSSDIWVIPESWVKASEVHTAGEPVPWSVFTRYLRRPAPSRTAGGGGNSGSRSRFDAELLQLLQLEHPWLTVAEIMDLLQMNSPQALAQQPRASPLPSGASSSSTGQGSSRLEAEELPEDIVAKVNENLEAIRAEVAEGNLDDRLFFNLRALGGEWSVKQGRKLTTDFQSVAKDTSIATWCEKTLFPERKSFSTNYYGHLNSRMLAEEVVRRGEYFFGAWLGAGSPAPYDYNPLVPAYRSPAEYQEWFDDLPLDSFSSKAAFLVRDLIPLPLLE